MCFVFVQSTYRNVAPTFPHDILSMYIMLQRTACFLSMRQHSAGFAHAGHEHAAVSNIQCSFRAVCKKPSHSLQLPSSTTAELILQAYRDVPSQYNKHRDKTFALPEGALQKNNGIRRTHMFRTTLLYYTIIPYHNNDSRPFRCATSDIHTGPIL